MDDVDTAGKDGNEEQVEAMTVCCPANEQHPARSATRSNIPCTISKAATWKRSDTNDLDNLDEPAYCKEDNDSLLSS